MLFIINHFREKNMVVGRSSGSSAQKEDMTYQEGIIALEVVNADAWRREK